MCMRKYLVIAVLAVMSYGVASAQSVYYFSVNPKEVFAYTIIDDDGAFFGRFDVNTHSCSGDLQNGEVVIYENFYDKNNKPIFKESNQFVMDIALVNGEAFANIGSLSRALKVQDYMSKGDIISLPSTLLVGGAVPDGKLSIKMGAIKGTITVTDRKVIAYENISTQAGSFMCYKITERQISKTAGLSFEHNLVTWYCKGIGCVKQICYDKKGKLINTIELVSIKGRS